MAPPQPKSIWKTGSKTMYNKTYSLKNLCQNATVNTNKSGKMVDFFLRGLPYIYIVIVNIHTIKL